MSTELEIPMIRIELQSLRQTLVHAFNGHCEDIKKIAAEAIEAQLQPERIRHLANEKARELVDQTTKDAVNRWFLTEGRNVIMEYISHELEERKKCYLPSVQGNSPKSEGVDGQQETPSQNLEAEVSCGAKLSESPCNSGYIRVRVSNGKSSSHQDIRLHDVEKGVYLFLYHEAIKRAAEKLGIDLEVSLERPKQTPPLRLLPVPS